MSTVEWEKDVAQELVVHMVDATDDESAEPSKTLAVSVSKGGASSVSSVSPTQVDITGGVTGSYRLQFTAGMIDTAGPMLIEVTAAGCNDFLVVREVVDRTAVKYYIDDVSIHRIAAAVLTTKRATAIANTINALTAAPHIDHREALVGSIALSNGQWAIAGSTITIRDSAGVDVYTKTITGTVGADAANLATGVNG